MARCFSVMSLWLLQTVKFIIIDRSSFHICNLSRTFFCLRVEFIKSAIGNISLWRPLRNSKIQWNNLSYAVWDNDLWIEFKQINLHELQYVLITKVNMDVIPKSVWSVFCWKFYVILTKHTHLTNNIRFYGKLHKVTSMCVQIRTLK